MKELINFIKWQWNKWQFWQKCFICSAAFFGAGISADYPYSIYLLAVPSICAFSFMTKWLIWDGTKAAWNSYKKEKAELFKTIDEGK